MRTSESTAVWRGGLPEGEGSFRAGSGAFEGSYSFATRFKEAAGTNPEELLAAAHAACLAMAISHGLSQAGHIPERIQVRAACTIDSADDGFRVTRMHLEVHGVVPGLEESRFLEAAADAKENCPISKALAGNVQLELEATLEES